MMRKNQLEKNMKDQMDTGVISGSCRHKLGELRFGQSQSL